MKTAKNIAILFLAASILAVLFAMAQAVTSVSETVQDMPGAIVEARATGTSIAPAIAPTLMYNKSVVPTIQAEEANQATQTVIEREGWQRTVDAAIAILAIAWRVAGVALAVSAVIAALGMGALAVAAAVAAMIALGCWAWEQYKSARAFVPFQVLPDQAIYWPKWRMSTDARTGLQSGIRTEHPAREEHGHLLIERQMASLKPGTIESVGNTINQVAGAITRYRVRVQNRSAIQAQEVRRAQMQSDAPESPFERG